MSRIAFTAQTILRLRPLNTIILQNGQSLTRRLSILPRRLLYQSNGKLGRELITNTNTNNVDNHKRGISSQEGAVVRQDLTQYLGGSIDLEKDDVTGIASMVLNHQGKKNALSGKMMVEMRDAVAELEQWKEGKGLVFYGAGGTLCSGGDLQLMQSIADPISGSRMCQFMQETTARLSRLPLVSVAVINGRALGGGAELAVACDFRLMADSAKIGFVQARMGVSPGWGGGARLVHLLGPTLALELLVSARILTCSEAMGVGLVSGVLDGDTESPEQAKRWLMNLTQSVSPAVIQAAKNVVNNALYCSSGDMLAAERDVFTSVWGGPAHLNAIKNSIKHD